MKIILRIAAAFLVLFLAVEASFRLFVTQDALVYQDSRDGNLLFELKPGAAGRKFGTFVQINRAGLRERELPERKPADEFRIVVVGDQFTFGLGIPVEQSYVRLLESMLARAQDKKVRTINLSMYSYNFRQKLALLRSRGLRYEPDAVVFQVYSKDFKDLPDALVQMPGLKNWLRDHSAFLRWLFERIFWSRKPEEKVGPPGPNAVLTGLRNIRTLLITELKVPVLIVFCPNLALDAKEVAKQQELEREFERYSRELGLPFYSLSAEFKGDKSLLIHPSDPWLGPQAHERAARGVAQRLRRIIPARKAPAQRPGV